MTRASPFTPQSFTVEGLAAVAEYVRFRPQAITAVRCERRLRAEVDALLKAHGVMVPVSERDRPGGAGERGEARGGERGEGRGGRGGEHSGARGGEGRGGRGGEHSGARGGARAGERGSGRGGERGERGEQAARGGSAPRVPRIPGSGAGRSGPGSGPAGKRRLDSAGGDRAEPTGTDPGGWDGGDAAPVTAQVTLKAMEPDAFEHRLKGRSRDLVLALDHITDPRNLGAIVRSAAFFGVREVLAPERRQVLLTQSAVATAQGGFALTDLVCVVNLGRTLASLKEKGYWVIGTAMDGEAFTTLAGEYEKVVLVLGAEEDGLSKGVRELCDRLAAIPGRPAGLESLNVSVAAGIVLSAFAGRL